MTDAMMSEQRERLRRFSAPHCSDLHCHCLPGLDDGPESLDDALALCEALAADGVTQVVATPHQLGMYDGRNGAAEIRKAVAQLDAHLEAADVPLEIVPGADVRVDERIVSMIDAGEIMTVADQGTHLLLELPRDIHIDPALLVTRLRDHGITTIVSHPERYPFLARRPQIIETWIAEGALIQLTAGSLIGEFGRTAHDLAWHWLRSPAVRHILIATDAHDTDHRPPRMTAAIEAISQRLGHATARRACIDNPNRILSQSRDLVEKKP